MEPNLHEKDDNFTLSKDIDHELDARERGVYDYMPDSSSFAFISNFNKDYSQNCNGVSIEMKTLNRGQANHKSFIPNAVHKPIHFDEWLYKNSDCPNYEINGNLEKVADSELNEIIIDNGTNCLNNNNLYTSFEDQPTKSTTEIIQSSYNTVSLEEGNSRSFIKEGADENIQQNELVSSSIDDKIDYYNSNNSAKDSSMELSRRNGIYVCEPYWNISTSASTSQTLSEVEKRRNRRDKRKRRQTLSIKKAEEVNEYKGKLPVEDLIAFIDGPHNKFPDHKASTLTIDAFKLKKVQQNKKKSANIYETSSDTIEHSDINDFQSEKGYETDVGNKSNVFSGTKSNINSNKIDFINKSVIKLSNNNTNLFELVTDNEFITVQKKKRIKPNEIFNNDQSKLSKLSFFRSFPKSKNSDDKICSEVNNGKLEESTLKINKVIDNESKLNEMKLLNPASFPALQNLKISNNSMKLSRPNEGCDLISMSKPTNISYADIASRKSVAHSVPRRRSLDLTVEIPLNDNSRSSIAFLQNVNNSNVTKPSDNKNLVFTKIDQEQQISLDNKVFNKENMVLKSDHVLSEIKIKEINKINIIKKEPVVFLDHSNHQKVDKMDILFGFETNDPLPRIISAALDEKCNCISNCACICNSQSSVSNDIATSPINVKQNDIVTQVGITPSVLSVSTSSNYPYISSSRPIAPLSTSSGYCSIRTPVVVVNPMLSEKSTNSDLEDNYFMNKKDIYDLKNFEEIKAPLIKPKVNSKNESDEYRCAVTQKTMFNLSSAQHFLNRGYEDVLKKMRQNPEDIRYYAD